MTVAFAVGAIVGALIVGLAYERQLVREKARHRRHVAYLRHQIALLESQLRHPSVRVLRGVADVIDLDDRRTS